MRFLKDFHRFKGSFSRRSYDSEELKAVNLSKTFDGEQYLLSKIFPELKPGDLYFLKGKSGSGKTLFKVPHAAH